MLRGCESHHVCCAEAGGRQTCDVCPNRPFRAELQRFRLQRAPQRVWPPQDERRADRVDGQSHGLVIDWLDCVNEQ